MPHGIDAIRKHIKEVDNVPLLVSLFTDSTPATAQEMIKIFREHGETVLVIGAAYKSYNAKIFHSANIASSISCLPGALNAISDVEDQLFLGSRTNGLSPSDLELAYRLVGLGTFNLLQSSRRVEGKTRISCCAYNAYS